MLARGLAIAAAAVVAACTVAPPTATTADAVRANVELDHLTRGRQLLIAKCGGCHQTPLPSAHGAREWPAKLDEMSARAHLDRDQQAMIQQYLVVMAPH